ncbi:MAG: hypothetical protein A2381_03260 [Bdellovibrionales bacterium RIFOXYB1_FULL_37_110]|nr:MAG: hypothetical protein A2181_00365 [Bdellovibrionales bacterium RIFOXYA1_FULL_38_20]OFZ48423.1 MAG: hypothetical protein A2417_03750 [Bdellovibrionales bacterium RIFOXYC1_FULL_37_79]OFZ55255.1 MAG: hypothetical protein A2328_11835 [Bdellovibrionales bacterium RIFOXYB2_FULL_36_6]OFZ57944.1 MAG: hypothetical protein A2381_03260 [Bdellovibrionales bacterium RIFOXYB1_FULL_37_110]OFZ63081.1 MAG: hypothetical protein A2577_15390 [Bdellovibrionales bacterium RIFOXYD1_FULL_36_51]
MKLILLLTLFITFSTNSFADKKTLETVVTCEQHADSDQWTQIGIVIDNDEPGFKALVVNHNYDDMSSKLVFNDHVVEAISDDNQSYYYENITNTFWLTVTDNIGEFSLLMDGPNSMWQNNMDCFRNSKITFDQN